MTTELEQIEKLHNEASKSDKSFITAMLNFLIAAVLDGDSDKMSEHMQLLLMQKNDSRGLCGPDKSKEDLMRLLGMDLNNLMKRQH